MSNYEALKALPDVVFADTDAALTEQSILTMYEGITNTVLYPGDPVRLFLTTLAAVINQQKVLINDTGRQNLLRYARGVALDHLGGPVGVYRLQATYSYTDMEFTIQAVQAFDVVIPAGTRVTADGKVYFQTDAEAKIVAGKLSVIIAATCLSPGAEYNGLVAGQINRLVDQISYINKVSNTTESSGGTNTEQDEALRERISLAPESFNTAGSVLAYVFYALSAHPNIADVSITRPVPGTVEVTILLVGGRIPAQDGPEIKAVESILNPEQRRPLNDIVLASPATAVEIDYTITWYVSADQGSFIQSITPKIEQAVIDYETWQTTKLGRDIILDDLVQRCRAAGAKRIEVTGLDYRKMAKTEVCSFISNETRIRYGGAED